MLSARGLADLRPDLDTAVIMYFTQLEKAGVPHNIATLLMGHELSDMTFGGYSDGLMFESLKDDS